MSEELKTKDYYEQAPGVYFDSQEAILEGAYKDEISAYRAKKVWTETFETNFLLEPNYDFIFKVVTDIKEQKFVLKCNFTSACGRYAFWRLTRNQAPEAQYQIETAHIPANDSNKSNKVSAELSVKESQPLVMCADLGSEKSGRKESLVSQQSWAIFKKIREILQKN